MGSIASNLQHVRQRIDAAALAAGRSAHSITLLVVSKTFPPAAVREAHAAGARAFGENYVQEALAKIEALADLRRGGVALAAPGSALADAAAGPGAVAGDPIEWHFIGPLQSNKTRPVAEQFDWVHSIDRLKVAERLAAQRPADLPPLNLCLQVNVSGEASKGGVAPEELPALAAAVAALPAKRVRLRGLMSIPEPVAGFEAQRLPHRQLHEAFDMLRDRGFALDVLSMGMSADLEAAVAEGATLVRVGSAIFGARAAPV